MKKAIVTFAADQHKVFEPITRPALKAYCVRHGYDLLAFEPFERRRPLSWYKVMSLWTALQEYDVAVWVDADVLVRKFDRDILLDAGDPREQASKDLLQALAVVHTDEGSFPSCGVWVVYRAMRNFLKVLWEQEQFINHPWWEQAALHHMMGIDHTRRPVDMTTANGPIWEGTKILPPAWNWHRQDSQRVPDPYFAHATTGDGSIEERLAMLSRWADGGPME